MTTAQLAFVRGWDDTTATLRRWRAAPLTVLAPWALGSLLVTAGLLLATWLVAVLALPDPSGASFPGVTGPATLGDFGFVLLRNGLVLALHALACVAGFMAGSSLPLQAREYRGVVRWIHEKAGPLAIAFVLAATAFSLLTQAFALGHGASTLSAELGVRPAVLLLATLPHALPELFGLFLPLAAWTIAGRRDAWHELLAATFVTTALALPLIVGAAAVETWISPALMLLVAR